MCEHILKKNTAPQYNSNSLNCKKITMFPTIAAIASRLLNSKSRNQTAARENSLSKILYYAPWSACQGKRSLIRLKTGQLKQTKQKIIDILLTQRASYSYKPLKAL